MEHWSLLQNQLEIPQNISLYGCKIWGRFANGETPLKTENLKREKNICGAIFSEVMQEIS